VVLKNKQIIFMGVDLSTFKPSSLLMKYGGCKKAIAYKAVGLNHCWLFWSADEG
jgi:hypothetical protein